MASRRTRGTRVTLSSAGERERERESPATRARAGLQRQVFRNLGRSFLRASEPRRGLFARSLSLVRGGETSTPCASRASRRNSARAPIPSDSCVFSLCFFLLFSSLRQLRFFLSIFLLFFFLPQAAVFCFSLFFFFSSFCLSRAKGLPRLTRVLNVGQCFDTKPGTRALTRQ